MGLNRADVHLIIAVFLGALIGVQAWDVLEVQRFDATWGASPDGVEDYPALANTIFETWAVPFEVLSLVLLVALVGAIALAARNPDEDEGGVR